ncbi:MAG: ComF family protein [Saprospiraceae bacterium]|nr:ComF family protein [Saprospiraceae bacterium]
MGEAFLDLLYPRLCAACGIHHPIRDAALCVSCQLELPRTDYHLFEENPITRRLMGRFPLQSATSMFYFVKDTPIQHLLHRIKYLGRKEAAWSLGRQYGRELRELEPYAKIDLVIPVPLHPSREHQRGYNQSAWLARGLAEGLDRPVRERALSRARKTETQTHKSRQERLFNTEGAFLVREPRRIIGKHVLLVDDVMTTGATLEACALPLLQAEGVQLSIVTLAIAQD